MVLDEQFGHVPAPTSYPATEDRACGEVGAIGASSGHWLNVVSHLDPKYGGLSAVVPQLCSCISSSGPFSIELAAFCAPGESYSSQDDSAIHVSYWPASRLQWWKEPALRARFREKVERSDGVHIHGLWEQSTAIAARTARSLHKPYILSAHGMLDPWAIKNRQLKKLVYSALVERANVDGASCLHALTGAEAADYRRFGARGPIAVVPNGVHIPSSPRPELFLGQFPDLKGKRIFLFLGRLHRKKGIDLLVEAWPTVAALSPESHLVIAGPDFEGTRGQLETKIQELGLGNQITLTGMLRGEHKWSALAAAECFILPSYSEGLSISVLEAMGMGMPVIISEQCNLPEVNLLEIGWVIQSNIASLTYALKEVLLNSCAANKLIGEKAGRFVASRYTWPIVAAQMSDLYRWVQGGPLPQHVDLRLS